MPLLALGVNHKTAPVHVRERVAFSPDRVAQALQQLKTDRFVREAAILSTCNRTELYCGLEPANDPAGSGEALLRWLGQFHDFPTSDLAPHIYRHLERGAVRHVMRVAAGLDSLVLGEPQILGQVKSAYQAASRAGTLGARLERLFQHSFAVAKQVRTDTAIGANAVSVAYAAVSLGRQIFADFNAQTALLIGAGETIELVARYLTDAGIGRLIVANRTFERAHLLAERYSGFAVDLVQLPAHLGEADIIVSSTASPDLIVKQRDFAAAIKGRRHRPVYLVDIAVPRDIDPAIADLDDVYLYTVDDLGEIIEENRRSRQAAAEAAEQIVDSQAERFMSWLSVQEGAQNIARLRQCCESARDEVLTKALRQMRSGKDPEEVLQFLAHTLTNKLLHHPSQRLRDAWSQGDEETIELINELYCLKDDSDLRAR